MPVGGLREALIRGLLYVGMARAAVDERGFETVRRIRREQTTTVPLSELQGAGARAVLHAADRPDAALAAIPAMLPADAKTRQQALDLIRQVSGGARRARRTRTRRGLQRIARTVRRRTPSTAPNPFRPIGSASCRQRPHDEMSQPGMSPDSGAGVIHVSDMQQRHRRYRTPRRRPRRRAQQVRAADCAARSRFRRRRPSWCIPATRPRCAARSRRRKPGSSCRSWSGRPRRSQAVAREHGLDIGRFEIVDVAAQRGRGGEGGRADPRGRKASC